MTIAQIPTRLLEIFQADELFSSKISEFRIGELVKEEYGNDFPLCYVTTVPEVFSTADRMGSDIDNSDVQSTVQFQVGLVVNSISAKGDGLTGDIKLQLLDLFEDVKRILENNKTLKKPTNNDYPLCIRSVLLSADEVQSLRGGLIQAMIIILQCQIGNQITITIPGIANPIPLISKPVSREYVTYAPHISTSGELSGYAATGESKTRYYEIEDNVQYRNILNGIKNSKEKIRYRVNDDIIDGYLSAVNPSYNYDGLPLITLQFEVL